MAQGDPNQYFVLSGHTLTGGVGYDIDKVAFIKDNNIYNVYYFSKETGNVVEVADYYGVKDTTILGVISNDTLSIENHNKELHIGTGGSENNRSMWVGKPLKKTFNSDNKDTILIESADIMPPDGADFFDQTASDGTYIYGHRYNGSNIYKVSISTGAIDKISETGEYKDLRAIDYYNNQLWVFDQGNSEHGSLNAVDTDTLSITMTCGLSDYEKLDNAHISDMIVTSNKVWFSHSTEEFANEKILFNANVPTNSNPLTLTDRTPDFSHWFKVTTIYDLLTEEYNFTVAPYIFAEDVSERGFNSVPRKSLCRISSTSVGFVAKYKTIYESIYSFWIRGDGQGGATVNYNDATHTVSDVLRGDYQLNVIDEDYTSGLVKIYDLIDDFNQTGLDKIGVYQDSSKFVITYGNMIATKDALTDSGTSIVARTVSEWTVDLVEENINGTITSGDSTDYFWTSSDSQPLIKKINISDISTQSSLLDNKNTSITITDVSNSGNFPEDKTHHYRISYTYDGYQESPFSEATYTKTDTGQNTGNKSVEITINNLKRISKRVSHLNLYRSTDDGFFRLVKSVRADDPIVVYSDSDSATITIIDNYESGASYEARTGLPEVMKNLTMNYGLSTQINNQLIVGDCWHKEVEDAENYIFKSKPYRYDTFNWASDYLTLPQKPVALQSFNGKVYVFSETKTFKVNADRMIIEDTFDNAGCIDNDSVLATEYGMFYASHNNIYMHNGSNPVAIADPILRDANGYGWQDNVKTNVSLSFNEKRSSLLVFFTIGSNSYCWMYNIPRRRWDLCDAPKVLSVIIGKNKENIIATASTLYEYMGGTGTRSWEWESKSITLNADSQDKMFYKLRGVGDSHTIQYKVYQNGSWSSSWQSLTSEKIASGDKKAKAIKIKVTPNSSTDEIDSLGIIYRALPVR